MGRSSKVALGLAALVAGWFTAAPCAAGVALCVEVEAPAAERAGVEKLVASELARHPSHQVVTADCRSHLRVEVFQAAGARYLTAQIDREVPARYVVQDATELGARLSDALSLVLHNDPTYLSEDISHLNDVQRFGHSILQRGVFSFRLEAFEAVSRAGDAPVFASGGAFSITRGSGHWQVLGRMYLAGDLPPASGTSRVLAFDTGLDAGITYEFSDKAFASPYLSTCLGVSFLRFAGRDDAGALALAQHVGATASVRGGLRLFRYARFDVDVFAQAYAPLFLTSDEDGSLFKKSIYTPTLQFGVGVGF